MSAQPPSLVTISAWPQSTLTMRARQLAADGHDQAAIMAELARQYPDQPSENHYANPAAIAVMERIRAGQREQLRAAAHDAYRVTKGMPALAAGPSVGEPDAAELAGIGNGRDLVRLCRRYGIELDYDDAVGGLRPSRPIERDGALAAAIGRFRSSLIKMHTAVRAEP